MELLKSVGLEPPLLLMQAISFLALYLVLRKYLFGPIIAMIDRRNDEVRERHERAARDEEAMENVRVEWERRIAEIETQTRDRIQAATAEARRIAEELREQARLDAQFIRMRAMEQIEREKDKALKELQDRIVDLAVDAAEATIGGAVDEVAQRRLIRAFIEEVGSRPA